MLLKSFAKLTGSYICQRLFSNEVEGYRLKRDSSAGVFQWILLNFQEQLFRRTCSNCCFWYLEISLRKNIFCKVSIEEIHSFLQHLSTHSFWIDFRILHNLRGVFRNISNNYDEAFSCFYFRRNVSLWIFGKVLNMALQPRF